ncbi:flagellar motor switch protein FliN [Candidatus Contendibacter odensensis]
MRRRCLLASPSGEHPPMNSQADTLEPAEQAALDTSPELRSAKAGQNLDMVMDIPINLSLELGHTRMSIRELLRLTQGSVVKLDRPGGDPLDILVNGCLVARGEVVVINERFGVRITDIVSPEERIRRLR